MSDMMEIDRMSYIFGSFARRRQSQQVNNKKSIKISHDRSKSTPHSSSSTTTTTNTPSTTTPLLKHVSLSPSTTRSKSVCNVSFDESKFKCPMCRRHFIEPRVLPCLHTFCLRCIQELMANAGLVNCLDDDSEDSTTTTTTNNGCSDSANSGYMSDPKSRIVNQKSKNPTTFLCPICKCCIEIPNEGSVKLFPPNYLLQHRMILATLNAQQTHLLCDLCTSEITAVSRCMECALSFCHHCEEIHLKQKPTAHHEVLDLVEARRRGITRVRRQIMCVQHPNVELSIFCSNCYQVICKECISVAHKNHRCEPVSRAIKTHITNLRLAAEKAKSIAEQSALTANRLHAKSKKIEIHTNQIQTDVEKFIENYLRSIEDHRKNLLEQITNVKSEQLQEINKYRNYLHRRVREAHDVACFLEELLTEGTDVEVMSFFKPIMMKLETCTNLDKSIIELNSFDSLQFLTDETVQYNQDTCPLYGVITTQTVSTPHCVINTEALNNLRVGKKTEIILETRDRNNTRVERGGEEISAEIRYRDAGIAKILPVDVEDCRDGTYCISFIPDVSGKLILSINIKGKPIKDNPFPILVRSLRPHHGTFHCCSFCSSGGSKEATCGCGGRMPGGYRGCGHGHEGHPGRRHWSCCGNIIEHSECNRTTTTTTITTTTTTTTPSHYQFTL